MGEIKKTSTPYDDVFRTLLNDCTSLIIPVINEVFGENYTGKEEIVFSANEHFLNQQDGNEEKRTTDSSFKVVGKKTKKYHWECQSNTDSSPVPSMQCIYAGYNENQDDYTGWKCNV